MIELKPCPCCGGEAEVLFFADKKSGQFYRNLNWYTSNFCSLSTNPGKVMCKKCKLQTQTYATAAYAVKRWNRRVEND